MDGTLRVTTMSLQTRSVDIRSSDLASLAQAADLGQGGYPDSYARKLYSRSSHFSVSLTCTLSRPHPHQPGLSGR